MDLIAQVGFLWRTSSWARGCGLLHCYLLSSLSLLRTALHDQVCPQLFEFGNFFEVKSCAVCLCACVGVCV